MIDLRSSGVMTLEEVMLQENIPDCESKRKLLGLCRDKGYVRLDEAVELIDRPLVFTELLTSNRKISTYNSIPIKKRYSSLWAELGVTSGELSLQVSSLSSQDILDLRALRSSTPLYTSEFVGLRRKILLGTSISGFGTPEDDIHSRKAPYRAYRDGDLIPDDCVVVSYEKFLLRNAPALTLKFGWQPLRQQFADASARTCPRVITPNNGDFPVHKDDADAAKDDLSTVEAIGFCCNGNE